MKTRKEVNDILIDMQNGKICIGTACDRLTEQPEGEMVNKLYTGPNDHNYLIPLSEIKNFNEAMLHIETVGCQGESENAYYSALDYFDNEFGKYRIDDVGVNKINTAFSLLLSMISSGKFHTNESIVIVDEARKAIAKLTNKI